MINARRCEPYLASDAHQNLMWSLYASIRAAARTAVAIRPQWQSQDDLEVSRCGKNKAKSFTICSSFARAR